MINEVFADELAGLLHSFGGEIEVLSLDCFDTLLWRTVADPTDLFCELPPPATRVARRQAEKTARQQRFVITGNREVGLEDIYRSLLPPGVDDAEVQRFVDAEIALEHRHCVAFPPAVALIRNAKRRGLKVVVVSDTYLSTAQLEALLASCLGEEVAALIDAVFASRDHGRSKLSGLFDIVLDRLGVPAPRVLHVGDNPRADLSAALQAGMQAVQLLQGDERLQEQWRLEAAALLVADPTLRHRAPPLQPHRLLQAERLRRLDQPAQRLGYGTLGPILHGFASWVRDEARALGAGGRRVKVCFLLRDGFLPKRVYDALAGPDDAPACALELSRFAAYAASMRSAEDVIAYTGTQWKTEKYEAVARQLLFTPNEARQLIAAAEGADHPMQALTAEATRPHHLRKIINRSTAERQGLLRYLRQQLAPAAGDIVLLVDTGTVGTVQNRLQPIIEEAFGVEVHGRYLLLVDGPLATVRKRGYFGPDRVDGRMLKSHCSYASVLEQLCTVAQGSTIGFTDAGKPRRMDAEFAPTQVAARETVQAACLQFVGQARDAARSNAGAEAQAQWQGALAAYTRLLFLPLAEEAEFFDRFVHDVNLGARDTVRMVDREAARQDLLRLGPMYVNSTLRVFAPAELRRHGLDLALQMMTLRRLEVGLRAADFGRNSIPVSVMAVRGESSSVVTIDAQPTHDGFYSLSVPVGRCEFAVGVMFGQLFEWVQLESVRLTTVSRQFKSHRREEEVDLTAAAIHEQVQTHAGGLLQCCAPHSFSFFAPPAPVGEESCVLRVVFRPIAWRAVAETADRPQLVAAA